ncbi:DUF5134 domain-containing protein [Streptomyces sp. NPDC044948]|uniref:DUF5134 domain-containing protein n=1 Tax=Streptomyces sp. NPDC044948 TaxID=3157092 RepID=UPI0034067027
MTTMPLMPGWARALWAVALAGVVLVHVRHAWVLPGQRRWWHVGHTVMALGMAAMYLLPRMAHSGLYVAGVMLFTAVTVTEAAATVWHRRREGVLNPLWVSSTTDKLAMTYMLLSPAVRPAVLAYAFVVYAAGQALAWGLALWDRAPVLRQPAPAAASAFGRPVARVGLGAHSTPVTRTSLAVMAAGMAYMLAMAVM